MASRNPVDRTEIVYFFGTCLMDAACPDAGMAAIRLLEAQGAGVADTPMTRLQGEAAGSALVFSGSMPHNRCHQLITQSIPIYHKGNCHDR